VRVDNPALKELGPYQAEKISVASIGLNQIAAQKILDRVGHK
jgi:iron(III) transport system substrate-binding protein